MDFVSLVELYSAIVSESDMQHVFSDRPNNGPRLGSPTELHKDLTLGSMVANICLTWGAFGHTHVWPQYCMPTWVNNGFLTGMFWATGLYT